MSLGEMVFGSYTAALEPQTQKAQGVKALSRSVFPTIPHSWAKCADVIGWKEHDHPLFDGSRPYFARPCPTRPRHGFVESRVVRTLEDVRQCAREALVEDEQAEMLISSLRRPKYSGIITPSKLSVGEGHDGATSAKGEVVSIPVVPMKNLTASLLEDARIHDTPYMEVLFDNDTFEGYEATQLRDGPSVPATLDFIPEEVTVQAVLTVDPSVDLLDWERMCQEAEPGTVIYNPGGSLTSHYEVHGVSRGLPVITTFKPEVGQTIRQTENLMPEEERLNLFLRGYRKAWWVNPGVAAWEVGNKLSKVAKLAVIASRFWGIWQNAAPELCGLTVGMLVRAAAIACRAELRYGSEPGTDTKRRTNRTSYYQRSYLRGNKLIKAMRDFPYKFERLEFPSDSYGGSKWQEAAQNVVDIHNFVASGEVCSAVTAANMLVDKSHNTGWLFNKFVHRGVFDDSAADPTFSLLPCVTYLMDWLQVLTVDFKLAFPKKREGTKASTPDLNITSAQITIRPQGIGHIQYRRGSQKKSYMQHDIQLLDGAVCRDIKMCLNRPSWANNGEHLYATLPIIDENHVNMFGKVVRLP